MGRIINKPEQLRDYQIAIYNRWGELLFSTTSVAKGWNGIYQGRRCPIGTYQYVIQYVSETGKKYIKKGCVEVI
ncbi:MAG: gliding motility-associated C-terminal domain-containing protein [Bacteroidales bacterium]|jgi:gliding motility-associated-like protein|nr:gliding motility-associated C-terminal domain-containing protein [Bacteroidales bacterium]